MNKKVYYGKKIIKNKLSNQSQMLNKNSIKITKIETLINDVKHYDSSNIEGLDSRLYFKAPLKKRHIQQKNREYVFRLQLVSKA